MMEKKVEKELKGMFERMFDKIINRLDPKIKEKVELSMLVNDDLCDRVKAFCDDLRKIADTYKDVFKMLNIGVVVGFSTMDRTPCTLLCGTKKGLDKALEEIKENFKEVK